MLNVCQHEFNMLSDLKSFFFFVLFVHEVKVNFSSCNKNKKKEKVKYFISIYFATGYNHLHFPIGANEKKKFDDKSFMSFAKNTRLVLAYRNDILV